LPAAALVVVLGAAMLPEEAGAAGAAGAALGLAGAAGFAAAELVPLALACAFVKAGEMATVSIRQKASIHRVSLLWE